MAKKTVGYKEPASYCFLVRETEVRAVWPAEEAMSD